MVAHFCGFLLRKYDTPTEIPGEQKNLKKKGHKNHPQTEGTSTAFYAGPLAPKQNRG
jgi:hypothetical protein